jgi:hypothetical protein
MREFHHQTALEDRLQKPIASARRKLQWLLQRLYLAAMMTGVCCGIFVFVQWRSLTARRDGFEAERRLHPATSSKILLQRKSSPSNSSNENPSSSAPSHEPTPIPDSAPSASVTSAADKSLQSAPAANGSHRSARAISAAAPSSSSSDRFASRPRDSSDPDYDRHYGKYAPRNAMVPGGMAWPVLPTGGGYGVPVAGLPMGAPYEAMSPM